MKYFLPSQNFSYTRMLMFSWEGDTVPTSLSQTNAEYFVGKINAHIMCSNVNTFVINCNNVADVDDHFARVLIQYIVSKKLTIIFYSNDGKNRLVNHIHSRFQNDIKLYTVFGDCSAVCFSDKGVCSSNIENLIRESSEVERLAVVRMVENTFEKSNEDEILPSTPLKANGQFNATEILSDPNKFRWTVLIMSNRIANTVEREKIKVFTFVASSLRGAVLAGTIREILNHICGGSLRIIDHIGPKHNVIEHPGFEPFVKEKYCVYIGDFIIAGTEVKITQAYCDFFGGKVHHAFAIGKYTSLGVLNRSVQLHSLVDLKECNVDVKYVLE